MLLVALVVAGCTKQSDAEGVKDDTFRAEGRYVKAAGSMNPPDPVDACNRAKKDATATAAAAGYTGRVEWDQLSTDSDCNLKTQSAGSAGTYYIFTAKGTVHR